MELLLSLLHQQDVGGKTEWISANEDRYIDQRQIRKLDSCQPRPPTRYVVAATGTVFNDCERQRVVRRATGITVYAIGLGTHQVKSANNLAVQSNLVTHGLPGNRCVMAPREGDDATRRV